MKIYDARNEVEAMRSLGKAAAWYIPAGRYTLPPGATVVATHGKAAVEEDKETGVVSISLPLAGTWVLVSGMLFRGKRDFPVCLVAYEE